MLKLFWDTEVDSAVFGKSVSRMTRPKRHKVLRDLKQKARCRKAFTLNTNALKLYIYIFIYRL